MSKNTIKKGKATVFIYPKGNVFIGVCLEFGIIEEHKNVDILRHNMREAVEGYIEAVAKNNLSESLLNRPAPDKYWQKFLSYLNKEAEWARKRKVITVSGCFEVMTLPISRVLCSV